MKITKQLIICAILFACLSGSLNAQFNIKDKLLKKANNATDNLLNKKKNPDTKKDSTTSKDNKDVQNQKQPASTDQQSLKSYSKYDFIPGEQTIYFEDFLQDNIGDFPDKWNTNSSGEIMTLNNYPSKWFYMKGGGTFYPEAVTKFPDNFTLEFDMVSTYEQYPDCIEVDFIQTFPDQVMDGLVPGKGGFGLQCNESGFYVHQWKQDKYDNLEQSADMQLTSIKGKLIHLSMWVQKQRFRLYYEGRKIFDIPKMCPTELTLDRLRFFLYRCKYDNASIYVSNIRLAAAAPDMRSKLITEGKLVTHGIHFDSGSDKIKPESYGTLKEIANVLKENPVVKVKIIGHTDNDGGEAMNLQLSQKRAAAVKNSLTSEFAIEASRMDTEGKGMSQPISPNTTSEGKADNRRVEFIKL